MNVTLSQAQSEEGVLLSQPQPQRVGYEMCDRDFKITTCKVTQAAAVEDLKLDPVTLQEVAYAGPELALVGVYKAGDPNMVVCSDQADADANGVLSVWEYQAYDQADGTTRIPYNIRNGALVCDPAIPSGERFAHRAYVIGAPGLGQLYYVRIWDGYLAAHQDGVLDVESPAAKFMDPTPAPGASNAIRVYVRHPQGQSNTHVLWLLTYRPSGTF